MEKLIESIEPKCENGMIDKEGNKGYAGLCIRYSPTRETWLVSYGKNNSPSQPGVGSGYTIVEALDDFKIKQAELK